MPICNCLIKVIVTDIRLLRCGMHCQSKFVDICITILVSDGMNRNILYDSLLTNHWTILGQNLKIIMSQRASNNEAIVRHDCMHGCVLISIYLTVTHIMTHIKFAWWFCGLL